MSVDMYMNNSDCAIIKELTSEWEKLVYGFYGGNKIFVNKFNDTLKKTYFLSRKCLVNNADLPKQFVNIVDKMKDYITEEVTDYRSDYIKEYYTATKNVTAEFIIFLSYGINMREASDFCYHYVQLFLHYYDEYGKSILAKEFPKLSFSNSDVETIFDYIQLLKEKGILFE